MMNGFSEKARKGLSNADPFRFRFTMLLVRYFST